MWQFVAGIGIPDWKLVHQGYRLNFKTWLGYSLSWLWGAQVTEYDIVAKKALQLLDGPVDDVPSKEAVDEVIRFSNVIKREAVTSHRFDFRWDGLLRYHDNELNYDEKFEEFDTFTNQCRSCQTWHALRADWRKCYTCGVTRPAEDCEVSSI